MLHLLFGLVCVLSVGCSDDGTGLDGSVAPDTGATVPDPTCIPKTAADACDPIPGVTVLACRQDFPKDTVIVGGWIYWTKEGAVSRTALSGECATEDIWSYAGAIPVGIASDGAKIYWTLPLANKVFGYDLRSGATAEVAVDQVGAWGIDADATQVVWCNQQGGEVKRLDLASREMTDLAVGLNLPTEPLITPDGIFVSANSSVPREGEVLRLGASSATPPTRLASGFAHNLGGSLAIRPRDGLLALTGAYCALVPNCQMPRGLDCCEGVIETVQGSGSGPAMVMRDFPHDPVHGLAWLGDDLAYTTFAELRVVRAGADLLMLDTVGRGRGFSVAGEFLYLADPQLFSDVISPIGRILKVPFTK